MVKGAGHGLRWSDLGESAQPPSSASPLQVPAAFCHNIKKMKKRTIPAHELLVRLGLCATSEEAKRWIMAGKVLVDDQRVEKASNLVPQNGNARIKGMSRYIGKGGYKLEGALSDFGITVGGRLALDVGASTGGFTDCLLQHGATRVYSVDVGHGTLAGRLRNDDRVVNLENTNISDLTPDDLYPQPSFATVDLSYLSLRKAIPIVAQLLEPNGEMLCLVKPLFEVQDSQARRSGQIADSTDYRKVLEDLKQFVDDKELDLLGITHSHIRGNKGTVEFWMWISKHSKALGKTIDINKSVEAALELPQWNREERQNKAIDGG